MNCIVLEVYKGWMQSSLKSGRDIPLTSNGFESGLSREISSWQKIL